MKKYYTVTFIFSLLLFSCGNGPTFLYNWRPKPWVHSYKCIYTGIDNLINTKGYYVSHITDTTNFLGIDTTYTSIMFYNNGLCIGLNGMGSSEDIIPKLDTIYSDKTINSKNMNIFFEDKISWGTYELMEDTIKAYLIENTSDPFTQRRKNIISMVYIISDNETLQQIYIANSSKAYGCQKSLSIPFSTFHPIENKRDSTDCPYFTKGWFYKNDRVKRSKASEIKKNITGSLNI